jgi:hypothetical protein
MVVIMRVPALMPLMVMNAQVGMMMFIAVDMGLFVAMGVTMSVVAMFMVVMFMVVMIVLGPMFVRLIGLGLIRACSFHHAALDAVTMAAAARVAVPRAAAVGTIFVFFLGLAMGALIGLDQRLAVGDRNLIIVRMDFAEG